MSYKLPNYIIKEKINSNIIDYTWDDSCMGGHLDYSYANFFLEDISTLSLRAKIALAIGIYEWILGRYKDLYNDSIPFQVAEAACISIPHNRAIHI